MITLRLVGELELRRDDDTIVQVRRADSRRLVAFVYLTGAVAQTRSFAANSLWPDLPEAAAAARLRQAIHWLAVDLSHHGLATNSLVVATQRTIERPTGAGVTTDIELFLAGCERAAAAAGCGDDPAAAEALDAALAAVCGDLLEGWPDDWIDERRRDLRHRRVAALESLALSSARLLQFERGLAAVEAGLTMDATREPLIQLRQRLIAAATGEISANAGINKWTAPGGGGKDSGPPETLSRQFLFGREACIRDVVQLVQQHAVVALVGPPGVGKSAIAAHVQTLVAPGVRGAVRWIDVANLIARDALGGAITAALALPATSAISARSAPAKRFQAPTSTSANAQHMTTITDLIVLDDVDGVDAAVRACVDDVLAARIGAHFILTSRAPLGIDGEQAVPIAPLTAVASRALLSSLVPEPVGDSPFDPLVGALDGLPLGLVLAAEALQSRPASDVLKLIRDRPDLLTGDPATGRDVRHRNLATAIGASWARLPLPAQRMLGRLAMHGQPASFSDVTAAGSDLGVSPAEVLRQLVHAGLISLEVGSDDRARLYRVLGPVASYARARVQEVVEGESEPAPH